MQKIAFIGIGEAGSALVLGWGAALASSISAYDIKIGDPNTADKISQLCNTLDIKCASKLKDALEDADVVFSTVTADQAVIAAQAAAPHLAKGAFYLDLNSCAPSSKKTSEKIISDAGGRYVDVAVMSPVHPKLNLVPLLICGPHAVAAAEMLDDLPMSARIIDGPVGVASSIKMIRSVMVKGLEALTSECLLAAVEAGVEDEVLSSLMKSHPGIDWNAQAAYNFERAIVHGERRAAEMDEVVKTIQDLGLPSDMANATAKWQFRIAQIDVDAPQDARAVGARKIALSILPALLSQKKEN